MSHGVWAQCIEYFLCDAGLKYQDFPKNVWAHERFIFPGNWEFWKKTYPRTLHPKSQTFYQSLRFTSSLNVCSHLVSIVMPVCAKSMINEEKCQQRSQKKDSSLSRFKNTKQQQLLNCNSIIPKLPITTRLQSLAAGESMDWTCAGRVCN